MNSLDVPLRHLSEVTKYLVDDSVGVIRYVLEFPQDAGSPNFFHFYARAGDTRGLCAQQNSADAGGASTNRESALAKAIGEAVERYCSAIYQKDALPLWSFDSAPFPCIPPDQFALFSPQQYARRDFPFIPFDKETLVRWTPALDVTIGEIVHVPAAMVFVPYSFDKTRGELPILQPISTGLACHVGPVRAAISAVCEVIERDAFTITWQARLGRAQITIESLSDANRDLVERFERIGGKVTLLNLTMDHGVPAILSALRSTALDAPALVIAVASYPDPEHAVRKSLEELAHCYRYCHLMKGVRPHFTPSRNFTNVEDRDSHVALYCDHANIQLADFLFNSSEQMNFSEIENLVTGNLEQDFSNLVSRIRGVNHHVLLADVTTDDVRTLGLSVIRAIIPGFHPLVIGHHIRALGGYRLWEMPQRLGYGGFSKAKGDNPTPHPLP